MIQRPRVPRPPLDCTFRLCCRWCARVSMGRADRQRLPFVAPPCSIYANRKTRPYVRVVFEIQARPPTPCSPVGISASPLCVKCARSSGSGIGTATSVEGRVLLSSTNLVVHRFTFFGPPVFFMFCCKVGKAHSSRHKCEESREEQLPIKVLA